MKGIIFDMDGTMVDNMMVHHRAWQKQLASLGLEMGLEEVMEKIHGVNTEILQRLFGNRFSEEERTEISAQKEANYRQIFAEDLKLISGLPALLDELKAANIPMAIGTAAPPENANFVMEKLHLNSYFKTIVHSGDVVHGKPNPEVFEKAAAGLGLKVTECLIFEDSITGAETAANAGCPMIAVTTTHQKEEFAKFSHIRSFIKNYKHITLDYLHTEFHFK